MEDLLAHPLIVLTFLLAVVIFAVRGLDAYRRLRASQAKDRRHYRATSDGLIPLAKICLVGTEPVARARNVAWIKSLRQRAGLVILGSGVVAACAAYDTDYAALGTLLIAILMTALLAPYVLKQPKLSAQQKAAAILLVPSLPLILVGFLLQQIAPPVISQIKTYRAMPGRLPKW